MNKLTPIFDRVKVLLKKRSVVFGLGLALGLLVLLVIRFATYSPVRVHYHANFALYINGKREEFKDPKYYEEVAVCSSTDSITRPEQRAHMHDNINSVVHVHDHATTWGQFFANLGWFVGPDFIETADGTLYKAHDDQKLNIIIDGQDYTDLQSITNLVIKDDAHLLVSYGAISSQDLKTEFKTVATTADHYDHAKDPASCAGSEKVTFSVRLHHLF
jgi:hypothetical protein